MGKLKSTAFSEAWRGKLLTTIGLQDDTEETLLALLQERHQERARTITFEITPTA